VCPDGGHREARREKKTAREIARDNTAMVPIELWKNNKDRNARQRQCDKKQSNTVLSTRPEKQGSEHQAEKEAADVYNHRVGRRELKYIIEI